MRPPGKTRPAPPKILGVSLKTLHNKLKEYRHAGDDRRLDAMRLKTKLVLAITLLVFLISGMLSLVYVSQLLHAAVQQTYDTNHMVANQVRFALQRALETGPQRPPGRSQQSGRSCATWLPTRCATTPPLQAVIDSVNRYSLTVYDINIGDSQSSTLLSTNPDNRRQAAARRGPTTTSFSTPTLSD